MTLRTRSEIIRTLGNDVGNTGDSIRRWGGLAAGIGALITILGYDSDNRPALVGGAAVTGAGVVMLLLGLVASRWSSSQRKVADKVDELNLN